MAGKIFDQIGKRDIHLERVEQHEVPKLDHAMCPGCGCGPMDGVTGMKFRTINPPGFENPDDKDDGLPIMPTAGTPTVCAYCGELCIFREKPDGTMNIELPTPAEVKEWKLDPAIWKVLKSAHEYFSQKALEARLSGDMRYAKARPRRF